MTDNPFTRLLLTHGALVLAVGVLSGYGFWVQLILKKPEVQVRPWRVAHATLLAVGLTMLVAGLLGPHLFLTPPLRVLTARLLALSGWGFAFAMVGGALTGVGGLTPKPWGWNTFLFAGHALGAAGSTFGIGLIVYGLLARP
jgi:hypothetical protein